MFFAFVNRKIDDDDEEAAGFIDENEDLFLSSGKEELPSLDVSYILLSSVASFSVLCSRAMRLLMNHIIHTRIV